MDKLDLLAHFAHRPTADLLTDAQVTQSFVDMGKIEQFWLDWYLHGFIDQGVGKVKFIKGRSGAGKTHLLRHVGLAANADRYIVVSLDARKERLAAIDELYRAVARRAPFERLLEECARQLLQKRLGYADFTGAVSGFRQWAEATHGRSAHSLMADLRDETDRWMRELDLAPSWKEPIRASLLRRMSGETADESALLRWLQGERLSAAERRALGVNANMDRKSARAMLLSLATFTHVADFRGLIVLIDNAEVIAHTGRVEGIPYYTRGSRDLAYEMIRELIDESHHAPYLFVAIAGDLALYENQKTGFPSYPALWFRIHSEIAVKQSNRFADVVDLDQLWKNHKDDQTRLFEVWRKSGTSVELDDRLLTELPAETWGLEWAAVRRTVAKALSDPKGVTQDGA